MTPEQRRAHLILIGQPLLDEWLEYCRAWVGVGGPAHGPDRMLSAGDIVRQWRAAVEREYGDRSLGTWAGNRGEDFVMKNGDYYTFVAHHNLTGETK